MKDSTAMLLGGTIICGSLITVANLAGTGLAYRVINSPTPLKKVAWGLVGAGSLGVLSWVNGQFAEQTVERYLEAKSEENDSDPMLDEEA